ncbi:hypothetical protein TNCV_3043641 [Trichonephila clavipes]|nr:hypothetical protein TNCV_3043641 [Trichonephila clavipes]
MPVVLLLFLTPLDLDCVRARHLKFSSYGKGLNVALNKQRGDSTILVSVLREHTLGEVGDRLTNTFTKDFCVRITTTFKKDLLCLENENIFGDDQGDIPEIMDEILTTARDLEFEVNEDDIEVLIMGHEVELTIEELQETQ